MLFLLTGQQNLLKKVGNIGVKEQKLDIILDILKDEAKEMRTMIYDAGVSSFYLGKKGLAFVSCINTSEVRK